MSRRKLAPPDRTRAVISDDTVMKDGDRITVTISGSFKSKFHMTKSGRDCLVIEFNTTDGDRMVIPAKYVTALAKSYSWADDAILAGRQEENEATDAVG